MLPPFLGNRRNPVPSSGSIRFPFALACHNNRDFLHIYETSDDCRTGSVVLKKNTFIKNAFIMTATALLLRTIGIFFRIYMSNKIGAEGMGLYQLIFSIYVLGATFASTGICTAVTRLVTDELVCGSKKSVRGILRKAILLSVCIGVVSALLIFFGAEPISRYWLKDMRAVPALKVLCFSLPSMGVSSCLRGYFIARRKAASPSRAQIFEQIVRIAVVVFLIDRFAVLGLTFACAAVLVGDTVAEIASCTYLAIGYLRDRRRVETPEAPPQKGKHGVMYRLLAIAGPITAGRYLNTILRTIENILVPQSLEKFTKSKETALSSFGALKGMAMPLLFFPSSFLNSLSTLLIPEISEANALHQQGKVNRAVGLTLHITLLSSILLSGLFTLFANPLGHVIYGSDEVGFLLQVLAPLMPIMYVESVVDGMLKGLNQQVSSLKYMLLDSSSRIVMIFFLVPARGMEGFLFIMVVSNLLTCFLNTHRLLTVTGMKLQWGRWIIKPVLAMGVAAAFTLLLMKPLPTSGLPELAVLIAGSLISGAIYCVLLPLLGCITREELRQLRPRRSPSPPSEARSDW